MTFVCITKKQFQEKAWNHPFSELVAMAEAGEDGFTLLTVKDIKEAGRKEGWSYLDAQKLAGPNTALFRGGANDVAYLALQNW